MEEILILAINPGSTSTKIAVFKNTTPIFIKTIRHSVEEVDKFKKITDQYSFRKDIIYKQLHKADIDINKFKAIVGRGGLVHPIPSGVYTVNEKMKEDLRNSPIGQHASNLGGLIADDIAKTIHGAQAFIADPVVVDELDDIARFAGHPLFKRISIFHALNQKAVARSHAKSIMQKYEDMNLIVVHLGGGITVGAHKKGKVIDVNQGLDGEGPFSPERSGTLPVGALVELCFKGEHSKAEVKKMITGHGGLYAYLGTNSAYDIEQMAIAGDEKAAEVHRAMAYQVAKEVGAMCAVLEGDVDSILITGGIAHSKMFVNNVIKRVYKFAPVHVYPGEDEMRALAENALMVLKGEVEPLVYQGKAK